MTSVEWGDVGPTMGMLLGPLVGTRSVFGIM